MPTKFLLLSVSLALIFASWSCKPANNKPVDKYYIIIQRTSKSVLTNREEREEKIDSILTVNDESAFDSCMAMLYGMRIADSILLNELEKVNRKNNYPYFTLHCRKLGGKY